MKIENLSVDKIIPYEFNNKEHPEEQVNLIANSIKEFGFTQPLVVDKDNILIIGHGRLEASKKLGIKEIPVLRAENLNDTQIKKLRILDNKIGESEWNLENLHLELEELGMDLSFGDLELKVEELFPEFDAPEFNPEDYEKDLKSIEQNKKQHIVIELNTEISIEKIKEDIVKVLEKYKINFLIK